MTKKCNYYKAIKKYLENFEEVVGVLNKIEKKGIKIQTKLLGPIKAENFQRLN